MNMLKVLESAGANTPRQEILLKSIEVPIKIFSESFFKGLTEVSTRTFLTIDMIPIKGWSSQTLPDIFSGPAILRNCYPCSGAAQNHFYLGSTVAFRQEMWLTLLPLHWQSIDSLFLDSKHVGKFSICIYTEQKKTEAILIHNSNS